MCISTMDEVLHPQVLYGSGNSAVVEQVVFTDDKMAQDPVMTGTCKQNMLTVTLGSKKDLSVYPNPRHISVRNNVWALSSSTASHT